MKMSMHFQSKKIKELLSYLLTFVVRFRNFVDFLSHCKDDYLFYEIDWFLLYVTTRRVVLRLCYCETIQDVIDPRSWGVTLSINSIINI